MQEWLGLINHNEASIRYNAYFNIVQIIKAREVQQEQIAPVVEGLLYGLHNDYHGVRLNASAGISELAELEEITIPQSLMTDVITGLLGLVIDRCEGVRINASSAMVLVMERGLLQPSQVEEAAEALLRWLKDNHEEVRCNASEAIVDLLTLAVTIMPQVLIIKLMQCLLGLISDDCENVRINASIGIVCITRTSLLHPEHVVIVATALLRWLKDDCEEVRYNASEGIVELVKLEEIKTMPQSLITNMIESLLCLVADENEDVRMNASFAMGVIIKKGLLRRGQLAPLAKQLLIWLTDEYDSVRCNASATIKALVQLEEIKTIPQSLMTDVIEGLLCLVADKNEDVRINASFAMSLIIEKGLLQAGQLALVAAELLIWLKDEYDGVRCNASAAIKDLVKLEEIKTIPQSLMTDVITGLLGLVADRCQGVRLNAGIGILRITRRNLLHPEQVVMVATALLRWLKDDREEVRYNASEGILELVKLEERKTMPQSLITDVIEGLLCLVADENEDLRINASFAMGLIIEKGLLQPAQVALVTEAFLRWLKDTEENVKCNARIAMASIAKQGLIFQDQSELFLEVMLTSLSIEGLKTTACEAIASIAKQGMMISWSRMDSLINRLFLLLENPSLGFSPAVAIGVLIGFPRRTRAVKNLFSLFEDEIGRRTTTGYDEDFMENRHRLEKGLTELFKLQARANDHLQHSIVVAISTITEVAKIPEAFVAEIIKIMLAVLPGGGGLTVSPAEITEKAVRGIETIMLVHDLTEEDRNAFISALGVLRSSDNQFERVEELQQQERHQLTS